MYMYLPIVHVVCWYWMHVKSNFVCCSCCFVQCTFSFWVMIWLWTPCLPTGPLLVPAHSRKRPPEPSTLCTTHPRRSWTLPSEQRAQKSLTGEEVGFTIAKLYSYSLLLDKLSHSNLVCVCKTIAMRFLTSAARQEKKVLYRNVRKNCNSILWDGFWSNCVSNYAEHVV